MPLPLDKIEDRIWIFSEIANIRPSMTDSLGQFRFYWYDVKHLTIGRIASLFAYVKSWGASVRLLEDGETMEVRYEVRQPV